VRPYLAGLPRRYRVGVSLPTDAAEPSLAGSSTAGAGRHGPRYQARIESAASRAAVVAFVLAAVLGTILMWGERRPLAGDASLGDFGGDASLGAIAASMSAVAAGLGFILADLRASRLGHAGWRRQRIPLWRRIISRGAMGVGMGTLAYYAVLAVANLFQLGFRGLDVDPVGGAILAGVAVAALTYIAVVTGSLVSAEGVALLATLVLFAGTMASMLRTPDDTWWQLHFSQLGNISEVSGYRFNFAVVITGLLVTALAEFIGHDIERGLAHRGERVGRRAGVLAGLFAGMGLCLIIVGVVPDAVSPPAHISAAVGILLCFGAFLVAAIRLPGLARDTILISLLVAAGIVVAALLWVPIGYYNLAGTEFVAVALLFGWVLVFVRAIGLYGQALARA